MGEWKEGRQQRETETETEGEKTRQTGHTHTHAHLLEEGKQALEKEAEASEVLMVVGRRARAEDQQNDLSNQLDVEVCRVAWEKRVKAGSSDDAHREVRVHAEVRP